MDKFTVDLDQVLNDFEYSELTDQYNTRLPVSSTSSLNHNNVTKHSINNVFHSLNEYLNTSIDIASVNSIENDLKQVDEKEYEDCVDNENCGESGLSCDLNENVSVVEKIKVTKEDSINAVVADQQNLENGENTVAVVVCEDNSAEDKKGLDSPELEQTDKLQKEAQCNFEENITPIQDENSACNELINIEREDIIVQIDTTKNNDLTIGENPNPNTEAPSSISDDDQKVIIDEERMNPVGFEEVTDVDDEEINEMLAKLENDKDLIDEGTVSNEMIDAKGEHNEGKNDNEDVTQPVLEIKMVNEEMVTNISPKPQVWIENEPEEIATEKKDTQTETSNEESIEKNEVTISEDTLPQKEEIVNATPEPILKEEKIIEDAKENEKNEEEEKSIQEESQTKTDDQSENVNISNQEIVNRPKHLPLKEHDDGQREINLIGGPGSTPYNNVYISQEITKQDNQDNDSISSTSSNTFSDTGSTASTASTEEIRDDNDLTTPQVTEQGAMPKESIERGSKELADDDDEARNIVDEMSEISEGQIAKSSDEGAVESSSGDRQWLGKEAPLWIPDSDTSSCLHCDMKFTVLKRRHHCRACGLVLCSKCCYLRFKLEYLDAEARVCNKCHDILNKDSNSSSSSEISTPDPGNSPLRRPNPNNPLEYCSTISPLQQISGASPVPLPAVMVPVGVLKRKGSNKAKSNKSVMFCDGIRPGSDLTNLDNDFNYNNTKTKKLEKTSTTASAGKINRNLPLIDSDTNSFIPKNENSLPPLVTITKNDITYKDCQNNPATVDQMKNNQVTFAILLSLYVHVKIIDMNCCINKTAWCFSTEGLINVGQDEIVIILEYIDEEVFVPKDVFYHINNIYADAVKGTSIKELGISLHNSSNFLDSKNHAGFVYIRPTFQCLENIIKPKEPFLIGILIHRWEIPWAKLFPLRLILRLGAEYRYYPSPVISTRHRDSVFVEIGHTIINLLADFRNFSYTLPQISGLTIHMEDKNTTVTIPINRYDQVIKSLNNSSDHILAFGGSFSQDADSHLVCIQDTQGNENCYSTHAINIQNKPRKVTGASFIVFNGALKSSSGLTAKSNIVEDGLMIQILPEHMQQIRDNLRAMKNHTIPCGCVNAATDETVNIVWGENDTNFNIGVTSAIDGMSLSGIPSIRVHNGKNHYGANGNRIIRWTEVFIIQNGDDNPKNQDPVDISRISESIAKATCDALLNYLDLLLTNSFQKIGIRTTLHVDSVSYCAGSNNTKLPPIYMKSLDNELIPVLHRITSSNLGENAIILELIFRILNV